MTVDTEESIAPKCTKTPASFRADTLASSVFVLLAVTVIQRFVGFGRGVIYCRWLDPETLGQWDLAFGFLMLAAPVAVLGLPGSFGRYVEYYRQRGHLQTFLRRTALWTAIAAAVAVAAMLLAPGWFASQIFGEAQLAVLAAWAACCLAIVIFHHFLESLLMALRRSRVVSGMQFCQSVGFALLSVAFLLWRLEASSILMAYALASLISACGGLYYLRQALEELPAEEGPAPSQRSFWARLLPFAGWIWIANLTGNSFDVVDRYLLIHYSGLDAAAAMIEVGYYHSSRIVPLLLVGVAGLFGSIIMPYLSHDWESGRRREVEQRLNLALKIISLVLLASGVGVLLVAPLLFDVAFGGKYSGGLAVLPWTLTYCTLFGIAVVAQNYLWCCERAKLCVAALSAGLALNLAVNFYLVPRYGLMGAVWGTTFANLSLLGMTFVFNRLAGMHVDRGTVLLTLSPVALGFGFGTAAAVLACAVVETVFTSRIFHADEKQLVLAVGREYLEKFLPRGMRGKLSRPTAS